MTVNVDAYAYAATDVLGPERGTGFELSADGGELFVVRLAKLPFESLRSTARVLGLRLGSLDGQASFRAHSLGSFFARVRIRESVLGCVEHFL